MKILPKVFSSQFYPEIIRLMKSTICSIKNEVHAGPRAPGFLKLRTFMQICSYVCMRAGCIWNYTGS